MKHNAVGFHVVNATVANKVKGRKMTETNLAQAVEATNELSAYYGMVMTTELEGRIQTMCNLSENIKAIGIEEGIEQGIERGIEQGIERGIEQGIEKERLNAVRRMLEAGAEKKQILSFGYTEDEFAQAESVLCIKA